MKSILTEKEPKTYTCFECSLNFCDKSKFDRHMLVHTKIKSYECSFCQKKFSLLFNLKTHVRIHTGDRPYTCKVAECNKKFTQLSNLKVHQRTHNKKVLTVEKIQNFSLNSNFAKTANCCENFHENKEENYCKSSFMGLKEQKNRLSESILKDNRFMTASSTNSSDEADYQEFSVYNLGF